MPNQDPITSRPNEPVDMKVKIPNGSLWEIMGYHAFKWASNVSRWNLKTFL